MADQCTYSKKELLHYFKTKEPLTCWICSKYLRKITCTNATKEARMYRQDRDRITNESMTRVRSSPSISASQDPTVAPSLHRLGFVLASDLFVSWCCRGQRIFDLVGLWIAGAFVMAVL
ncbi:hypothetical protein BRADI_2g35014v3 [Brachypodium distachyon]|uniref:Uncharacterized protein n=1 Tax=Brachypodium distachyon TaxID=15368 RepID=A0A2K2DBW0_BRADI|nr:hypothetical protein BRADI_2g35014v3 [Brachypodium distachyon]